MWERDGWLDRATGQPVSHDGFNADHLGEVHHLAGRRVRPEWVLDSDRQVLLSRSMHCLATGVWGGRLLKLLDPEDPTQKATDATKPILFVRVDPKGVELWRTIR